MLIIVSRPMRATPTRGEIAKELEGDLEIKEVGLG